MPQPRNTTFQLNCIRVQNSRKQQNQSILKISQSKVVPSFARACYDVYRASGVWGVEQVSSSVG